MTGVLSAYLIDNFWFRYCSDIGKPIKWYRDVSLKSFLSPLTEGYKADGVVVLEHEGKELITAFFQDRKSRPNERCRLAELSRYALDEFGKRLSSKELEQIKIPSLLMSGTTIDFYMLHWDTMDDSYFFYLVDSCDTTVDGYEVAAWHMWNMLSVIQSNLSVLNQSKRKPDLSCTRSIRPYHPASTEPPTTYSSTRSSADTSESATSSETDSE